MLFKNCKQKTLEKMYEELNTYDYDSPQAARISENIERLEKSEDFRSKLTPDAVFSGLISLGGIVLIILAEGSELYLGGTKAWNFLKKNK